MEGSIRGDKPKMQAWKENGYKNELQNKRRTVVLRRRDASFSIRRKEDDTDASAFAEDEGVLLRSQGPTIGVEDILQLSLENAICRRGLKWDMALGNQKHTTKPRCLVYKRIRSLIWGNYTEVGILEKS